MKHPHNDGTETAELEMKLASGTLGIIEQVMAESRIKQLALIAATGPGGSGFHSAESRSASGATCTWNRKGK